MSNILPADYDETIDTFGLAIHYFTAEMAVKRRKKSVKIFISVKTSRYRGLLTF